MGDRFRGLRDAEHEEWQCDLLLDCRLWMVRVARQTLRAVLEGRYLADFVDTSCLLATEIVSNALLYTGGPVHMRFSGHRCGLRVSVVDQGVRPGRPGPALRMAADDDEGGRGLQLVETCANRWGMGPGPDGIGTCVWFELDEHACADDAWCGAQDGGEPTAIDLRDALTAGPRPA